MACGHYLNYATAHILWIELEHYNNVATTKTSPLRGLQVHWTIIMLSTMIDEYSDALGSKFTQRLVLTVVLFFDFIEQL